MDAELIKSPAEEYHARKEWSQSQFKALPHFPELFYGFNVSKQFIFKATADMELGTHLHAVWLEHEDLLVIPKSALTSNGQRRGGNWTAWVETHPNNPGVLEKDTVKIRAMLKAGLADPMVQSLMESEGDVEQSIVWECPDTGLPLRMRLDKRGLDADGGYYIIDLKATSIDVRDRLEVGKKIASMGYHQQAAHYIDGATEIWGPPKGFINVFSQNNPPYIARAYLMNENDVDLGRRHNLIAKRDLASRLESGNWHSTGFGELRVPELPKWAWENDAYNATAPEPYDEFADFTNQSGDES